ncbi:MAG: TIGR03960 family B12-binding radical SAM protein [Candidatus Electrothrix sp. GW3-4]|uniref:TIGR03960 family B12-binding radical SAM protein n=1 Tax=Candidatus Electrothrix sp. GW3-4 TaxID=3126740 RepID=UPI0030D16876
MTTKVPLDSILPLVQKPGRYIGGELNAVRPDYSQVDLSFALVFPDLYEIGMSHQGLQILYHIINRQPGLAAERCYAPDVDMEAQLRQQKLPIFSLETRRPLAEFDVIGFTLPYELCYTNILTVLDLAGIPFRSEDRGEDFPLIIGGGACAMNPEPVADFFDLIVLGDGEEALLELIWALRASREQGFSRAETLQRCADIEGVYVPSLFKPQYTDGQLTAIEPLKKDYPAVSRRIVSELPPVELLTRPLVPIVKPIHDRLGVEIARGCTRSCRFCQAGMTYRPVRERSREQIMQLAEEGIHNSGFDELALLSLSTGDYSSLPELLKDLMDRFAEEHVSVALPSMRVGTLTPEVIEQIRRVRKSGFTVAPEAGTDRLREVINKGITEEDLLAGCRDAFAAGWNVIKFYFMIGLPTETQEDLEAIIDLAMRAKKEAMGGRTQINVSVSTFVPKPHTPFQWHGQLSIAETKERIDFLKRKLPRKGFRLKWHEPYQSFLEGLFSRGDRRLASLIEAAWQAGARLDGWSDHFLLERWQEAAEQLGLDLDSYLRPRNQDEVLPWDHLHCGVDRAFLEKEYQKALDQVYTPDCRNKGCQQCGLCDFKSIKPLIQKKEESSPAMEQQVEPPKGSWKRTEQGQQTVFRYRVHYARLGDGRFLGHLEVLQLVFRGLQRSGLPMLFSQGFNPSPKVSFSPALPVGVESYIEYFDIDLATPIKNPQKTAELLNISLPDFLAVQEIVAIRKKAPVDQIISYQCTLPESVDVDQLTVTSQAFLAADAFVIERIRKQKKRELDLRPLVQRLELDAEQGRVLLLDLLHPHGAAGTSPREILEKVLGLSEEQSQLVRIVKWKSQEI